MASLENGNRNLYLRRIIFEFMKRIKQNLQDIEDIDNRRQQFYTEVLRRFDERVLFRRMVIPWMHEKTLFPRVDDFLKMALQRRDSKIVKFLQEVGVNIHAFRFEDGKSALQYLLKDWEFRIKYNVSCQMNKDVVNFFLEDSLKKNCDEHREMYFHGSCMVGLVTAVELFFSQGMEVNFDSYSWSPIHVAAKYRCKDVIDILLRRRVNCNQQDLEQSTPLHALANRNPSKCIKNCDFCNYREPVDEIVEMLIRNGANIENCNRHGETPLQSAVSIFDVELTKALLKYGASPNSFNKDRMFSKRFTPLELNSYPLTFNIIEVIKLLQSHGYRLDLESRIRMLKCWMRVQIRDTEYLLQNLCSEQVSAVIIKNLTTSLIYRFYMENNDNLRKELQQLVQKNPENYSMYTKIYKPQFVTNVRSCTVK
ncbi:hypothetical protein TKK_0012515 [Trichogramma kaykai]